MLELLAPVGSMDSFYQAVNNGCNAVYLAGKKFGARAYADNFSIEELALIIKEAHILGVKVFVTVNTLIKDCEMQEVLDFVKDINEMGVDAIIVQDIGLINLIHECIPSLPLHASTNMSCNSLDKAKELEMAGIKRVILAREAPISLVKEIKDNTSLEVEVFCHGALCMSYSGRCLLSSSIGGRSGNRGTCAQPCRMEYSLKKDGETLKKKYYLSPRDLCTIDKIEEFKKSGVDSLKIEGRMKRSEYVGVVTRSYRKALDKHLSDVEIDNLKKDMSLMFNRGFTKGFIFDTDNKHLTNVNSSNHIGIKVGEVIKYHNHYAYIKLLGPVNFADGLRFVGGYGDACVVNEMYVNGIKGQSAKEGDIIQLRTHNDISVGSIVLKTSDANLLGDVGNTKEKKIKISAHLYYDNEIKLTLNDGVNEVTCSSNFQYTKAQKKDSIERLKEQIAKSSDSHYIIKNIVIDNEIFMPIKEVNELRRRAIELLDSKRSETKFRPYIDFTKKKLDIALSNSILYEARTQEQIQTLLDNNCKVIVRSKKLKDEFGDKVTYIDPRISIAGYTSEIVDPYKNVLNAFSMGYYFERGSKIVSCSIEASKKNIKDTIDFFQKYYNAKPNVMVQIYGYQELMVMKHCLICKEEGHDEKGCGECLKHSYYLVDKMNCEYKLINDSQCNLVILNSKRLNLINNIDELNNIGVTNYLVSLKEEDKDTVLSIINAINNKESIHFKDETLGYYLNEII